MYKMEIIQGHYEVGKKEFVEEAKLPLEFENLVKAFAIAGEIFENVKPKACVRTDWINHEEYDAITAYKVEIEHIAEPAE